MKGLDLAEAYFLEFGLNLLKKFPRQAPRMAAGLVGDGSECFGFDDETSQDHDWGPGFCLWLEAEDHAEIGAELQAAYNQLPATFKGYRRLTTAFGVNRVGALSIGGFYRQYIGLAHAPQSLDRWLQIGEARLAACTNGRIFLDPSGRFSTIREDLLAFYPEDVRRVKIAAVCLSAAQTGQYNFLRSSRRRDLFAARYAETKFAVDMINLCFLLNKRYAPYYKWLHRAVGDLPGLGSFIHGQVTALMTDGVFQNKVRLIEEMSAAVIKELGRQGLSHIRGDFLLDHVPSIQAGIVNEEFKIKYAILP